MADRTSPRAFPRDVRAHPKSNVKKKRDHDMNSSDSSEVEDIKSDRLAKIFEAMKSLSRNPGPEGVSTLT